MSLDGRHESPGPSECTHTEFSCVAQSYITVLLRDKKYIEASHNPPLLNSELRY